MVSKIPRDNPTIIGADINASIGTKEDGEQKEEETNILGPHENKRKNNRREMILNMMRKTDLWAASTYFESKNGHDTWMHPAGKTSARPFPHLQRALSIHNRCKKKIHRGTQQSFPTLPPIQAQREKKENHRQNNRCHQKEDTLNQQQHPQTVK